MLDLQAIINLVLDGLIPIGNTIINTVGAVLGWIGINLDLSIIPLPAFQ